MTNFNKKETFEKEIASKLQELAQLCNYHQIPFFAAICVANNGKETEYVSEMISPAITGCELTDDRFPKYVNIGLGFDTVPSNELIEVQF